MCAMPKGYFYGVYLLCSQSTEKRFAGRCYVGFTVNPQRRINQHNRGKEFGGAKRTSNKGPWKMVMIVHGFPNNISALQFEWAWQQPRLSSRLKFYPELRRKQPKESYFQYNFRILCRMLNVGPWKRLSLTIRWLESDYESEFTLKPPLHMKIVSGEIVIQKSQALASSRNTEMPCAIWAPECHLCMRRIEQPEQSRIGCINSLCKLTCHIICLANHIISLDEQNRGQYVPIAGECPLCEMQFTWAALLERKRKLNANGVDHIEQEDQDDDYNELNGNYESDFDNSNDDVHDDSSDCSVLSNNNVDSDTGHDDDDTNVCSKLINSATQQSNDVIYVLSD